MPDLYETTDSGTGIYRRQPAAFDEGLQLDGPSRSMAATLSGGRSQVEIHLDDSGDDILCLEVAWETVHANWFRPFLHRLIELLVSTRDPAALDRLASPISDALFLLESAAPKGLPSPQLSLSPDGGLQATWTQGTRKCEIRFDRPAEADVYVAQADSPPVETPLTTDEASRLAEWLVQFVPTVGPAQTLLSLGHLYESGKRSKALDRLYALVDDKLLEKRFVDVVELFDAAPVADLPIALLLGLLTISKPWHGQLDGARDRLAIRVRDRLQQEDPERCDDLLRGLA